MGKGDYTFFWEDLWLGDRPLREKFPRLFKIARNKRALVQDVFRVGDQGISWYLDFRRDIRAFEVDNLNELKAQLGDFHLT